MEGIEVINISARDFFSLGAWFYQDKIYALAQSVQQNEIGLLIFDQNFHLCEQRIIFKSKNLKLANPRVLLLQEVAKVNVGLQISKRDSDFYQVACLTVSADAQGKFYPVILSDLGPGKNIIPLTEYDWCFTSCFNKKSLVVFRAVEKTKRFSLIALPSVGWARNALRLSAPPVWISSSEAWLIFYGISRDNGNRIYSLGRGKLFFDQGEFRLVEIDNEPFWQEEHYGSYPPFFVCSSVILVDNNILLFISNGQQNKVLKLKINFIDF